MKGYSSRKPECFEFIQTFYPELIYLFIFIEHQEQNKNRIQVK